MKPKRPPTPPPQPLHNVYGSETATSKRKPENYLSKEVLQARINRMRWEQNILIGMIMVGIILAMLFGKTSVETEYKKFEINYSECIASEIFAETECYDIAYTAAFGE